MDKLFDTLRPQDLTEASHDGMAALERAACDGDGPGLFVQVLDTIPVASLVTDANGVVQYANPVFLDQCPCTGEALDKHLVYLCLNKNDIERMRVAIRELRSGRTWHGRVRRPRRNGLDGWVSATYMPLRLTGGEVTHFVCFEADITAKVRDEQYLRRNEVLLSILFRISNTVHTTRDLPDLYDSIHAILRDFIDATNFFLAVVDAKNDRLVFEYYDDEKDKDIYRIENISDPKTRSLALDVIRSGKPLIITRDEMPARRGGDGNYGVVGSIPEIWLGVPLKVEGKTIGAMAIQDYHDPEHYTQDDVDLMVAVSEQVAMAVERKRMEQKLRLSEERYRTVSDSAFNMETWRDPDGNMLYVSPSCSRITGYAPEMFMEEPEFMERIIHRDDVSLWRNALSRDGDYNSRGVEVRFFRDNGRMHWLSVVSRSVYDEDGESLGVRCSMRDITEQKAMQQELRYTNMHDALTGLANRNLCLDRIHQTMERAKRRDDYHFAVVFLDVDRFRVINDSMGHTVGDQLLREVSYRLLKCVRSLDTVSRYGGDEFVVVLDEMDSQREAVRAAKRVREAMRDPFDVSGRQVTLTLSMGIVLSPVGDIDPEAVLRNANIAMYQAAKHGGNRIKVFNARMLETARRILDMEHDLRRALEENEFFLQYQPIMDVSKARAKGFEALVRWNHPKKGVLGPGYFIPFAEDSGQIIDLGLMVLREACATMARWLADNADRQDMHISVNLSCRQFSQPSLVEQVSCILEETGLAASNLKLEITESAIMEDAEGALSMLRRLKEKGIKLSIDDFGTGYSSLSYLQKFPVDTLKVDRSFISNMSDNDENVAIVRAVLVLAKSMGLDVVAEGVEEPEQLDLLKTLDCEYVQGFYFSRPLDTDSACRFIDEGEGG